MVRLRNVRTRFSLVVGILLLSACSESDFLVDRDDDAPPQILIITRDVAVDPRGDSEEAAENFPPSDEIDPMRLLWVQTYESEYLSLSYASARASFWAATNGSGASAAFQSVTLGEHALPRLPADCNPSTIYGELCWTVEMGGDRLNVYASDGDISAFTGRPVFTARGDEMLRDVSTTTTIPRPNRMANVLPGMKVNAASPWLIELDYPVINPEVFIEPAGTPDSGDGYKQYAGTNLYLVVDGEADRIVVPGQEVERLLASGADRVRVSLYVNPARNRLGRITLERKSDGPPVEVSVAMSSFHNVWDVMLVR